MDVLSVEEQDDGSAIVTLNMTQKENDMLIEYAVVNILREQLERMDNEHRTSGKIQSDEALESEDL